MFQTNPDLTVTVDKSDTAGGAFSTEDSQLFSTSISENYALIEGQLDLFSDLLSQTITAKESAELAETNAETAENNAENAQSYAEEWATKAEDSLISTDAGGDGSTDYSSLHHAAKAFASATTATTKAVEASDDADDASKLAVNPEDSQYTLSDGTTTGYSALHYSAKATASASAASTSESNASDSASDASKLAVNAEDSQYTLADGTTTGYSALHYNAKAQAAKTAAESARDATLLAYDNFDDRYLGAYATDPTLDNDDEALVAGALYFDTTNEVMKLYTGPTNGWKIAYADFTNVSTDDVSEGTTNLYYTDARAQAVSINNIVEDITPQLGGTLDANGNSIDMGTNDITDTKVGQWDTAYGWGDHSTQGYTVDGTDVTFSSVKLTGGTGDQGKLSWNSTEGTLDLNLGTATLQIGQEQYFYAKATEAISNGEVVMFAGAQGDHLLIAKADHNAVGFNPSYVVGVATQDFANNDFGYVTTFGKVRDLDTTSYTEGDILYFDPDNAGQLTTTKPTPPDHIIQVAAVTRSHNNEGTILVRLTHTNDTDEVPEGSTNLYYTNTRANSAIDTRVTQTFVNNLNVDADTLDGLNSTDFDPAGTALALSIALG